MGKKTDYNSNQPRVKRKRSNIKLKLEPWQLENTTDDFKHSQNRWGHWWWLFLCSNNAWNSNNVRTIIPPSMPMGREHLNYNSKWYLQNILEVAWHIWEEVWILASKNLKSHLYFFPLWVAVPHLCCEGSTVYYMQQLWGLHETMCVKCPLWCPACGRCSVIGSTLVPWDTYSHEELLHSCFLRARPVAPGQ